MAFTGAWGQWYEESEHPRGTGGRWTEKGGGPQPAGRRVRSVDLISPQIGQYKRFTATVQPEPTSLSTKEEEILETYAGHPDSATLNKKLRLGQELDEMQLESRDGLDRIMNHARLQESMLLYRQIGFDATSRFYKQLSVMKPGDSFRDPGFVSTAFTTENLSGPVIKILAAKGNRGIVVGPTRGSVSSAEMGDAEGDEFEVILDRDSRFDFLGQDRDGSLVFKLRQLAATPSDEALISTERVPTEKKFEPEKWRAMGMQKARAEWAKLSREQRDTYADARDSARKRLHDIVGFKGPTMSGNIKRDIQTRVSYLSSIMPPKSAKRAGQFATHAYEILSHTGVDDQGIQELTLSMLDHVAAQEYEAMGRSLGDHGEHHIEQDETVSLKLLSLLPENVNTPRNRALMTIAAAYHDTGYLTEPSRVFLNMDHPRWSQQYYQENIAPQVSKLFGKDFSEMAATLISTHSDSTIDWDNKPEQSCFSVADNLALFQEEKMPPLLREVPGNTKVLVNLGRGKIKLDEAQREMRENVKSSSLSATLKAQALRAIKEVSGVLPKYTLGMLGTRLGEIEWKDDHPLVSVEQHFANEELCKVLDFGQKQFEKLAETYNHSGEEFIKTGRMVLKDTAGKTLLEVRLIRSTATHRRMRTHEPWL